MNPFYHRIYRVVRHIPRGRVATYGIVARLAGRPATEETLARLGVRYVRKPFNLRDLRVAAARLWEATALS